MQANVALIDGEVAGIVGISRQHEYGLFFSEHKPKLQPYLDSITVMRAIRGALEMVKAYQGPVLAHATHAEACSILNRLGFSHLHGAWYGWLR